MQTTDQAPDARHGTPRPDTPAPRPPAPPRCDPRLVAAALNAFAAVVRWLDHHGGWPT